MLLGGCASMPKLSEEENKMVSEYAASLLLKYDSENHTRLVDTTQFLDSYQTALNAREESIKAYENMLEQKANEEAELENQPNFSTPEIEETEVSHDGTGGAEIISEPKQSLGEYLNADGFTINYAGNYTCKQYPEDSSMPASASPGKDLLVVSFNVMSSTDSALDIFSKNATFKVSVNGGSYITNNMTILDNDLSQFIGSIPSGSSQSLILLFEVKQGTVVSSLKMSVSTPGKESEQYTLAQ